MDEIIELLDEFGNKTNVPISKNDAHQNGLWHQAIHILIVNKDKTKTLIQKRCPDKKLYPNMWDIAVGGHVSYQEAPYISARRELEEELGIDPDNYELKEIFKIKESFLQNDIISNEYVTIYLLVDDIDMNKITLQKEEVSDIKWVTKKELEVLIQENKIIPHNEEYILLMDILK